MREAKFVGNRSENVELWSLEGVDMCKRGESPDRSARFPEMRRE